MPLTLRALELIEQIRELAYITRAGGARYDAPSAIDRIPPLLDELKAELRQESSAARATY